MAEIVNLTRFRKAQARTQARRDADANAAKFGRTKAERKLEEARAEQAQARLEAHRLEAHRLEAQKPENDEGQAP